LHRKAHMEIPRHVFLSMEDKFGELGPLFKKFVYSHISLNEINEILDDVDSKRENGELGPHDNPWKNQGAAISELNKVFRVVTGEEKLDEVRRVYERCDGKYKKAIRTRVKQRYRQEIEDTDVESSWRDYTSIYPDMFDGDNIARGLFHSYKCHDIDALGQPAMHHIGLGCQTIQSLIWRISGLYKEYMKEPDVIVSEQCKLNVVQEMIRLTHYVMDMSTPVHLIHTSGHFHSNFEKDLDGVVDDLLPKIDFKINEDLEESFEAMAQAEAEKRAKATFERFYFPVLNLYGMDTKNHKDKAKRVFYKGVGLDIAADIIQNACQNMADFWGYTLEYIGVEAGYMERALNRGADYST